jgi:hypothetical protein
VGFAQTYTGCNGSPATGKLQLAVVSSNLSTGSVTVNGVDLRQPTITPFTWVWGDGSTTQGWFPQSHVYPSLVNNQYTLQVTSHEDDGSTDCAQLVIGSLCTSPPSGIVGWWPGDGNTNDLIGGDNGQWTGNPSYAAGEVAQAFSFDGVSGVIAPNTQAIDITGDLTIEAWISPASGAEGYITVKGNGNDYVNAIQLSIW